MRLIGLDPGLRQTGWGVIEARDNRLSHIACGTVASEAKASTVARLTQLFEGVRDVIERYRPVCAAVEEVFVSGNAVSTLKLGQARGVVMLAPAMAGLPVDEYAANRIKKSVVGAGHADKHQVGVMVRMLLPGCDPDSPDAADALAVAICHAHHATTVRLWSLGREAAMGGAP